MTKIKWRSGTPNQATIWMIYDGRYIFDEERSTCFEVCHSLKEAKRNRLDYGNDCVIVEAKTEGKNIVSSKIIDL